MSVEATKVKAPWLAFYGVVPEHLQYPDCTMYEAVERCAQKYPSYPAYVFMGRKTSYRGAGGGDQPLCPCAEGHRRPPRR